MWQLLFSYGGPTSSSVITNDFLRGTVEIASAIEDCASYYIGKHQVYSFELRGFDHTTFYLHITWPHVFLSITLQDMSYDDYMISYYLKLNNKIEEIASAMRGKYKLLSNNCVTTIAKVIAQAVAFTDSSIEFPDDLIWPNSLIANLEYHSGNPKSAIRNFKKDLSYMTYLKNTNPTYQFWLTLKHAQSSSFLGFFRKRFSYWHKRDFRSIRIDDISNNAFGNNKGYKGERTLKVLLKMNWLIRSDSNKIILGADAPEEFCKSYWQNILPAQNDQCDTSPSSLLTKQSAFSKSTP